jgi:hypothetical protein
MANVNLTFSYVFSKDFHQKLDIYGISRKICPRMLPAKNEMPAEEKFGMITQIRRAVLCVHYTSLRERQEVNNRKKKIR